jgi:hypothetical protein
MRIELRQPIALALISCLGWAPLHAAEYNGQNIDGILFDATVYSYSTGRYYDVQLEFDGDEATIHFSNGGHIVVTLDDEEIDDPHNISAYDYQRGVYWDLDVDGLD